MNIKHLKTDCYSIALITGDAKIITDTQTALDLAMVARHETGASDLLIEKKLICEDFFILSTGLAGEVLQKLINYHFRAAIYGDYSRYTSKPLRDFIYESNHGSNFFFTASQEEGIEKLTGTQ